MQADESLVAYIASTYYDLRPILGSIKRLPGYDDRNFMLTDSADNRTYVLKIVNRHESDKELTDIIDEVYSNAYEYCKSRASSTSGKSHFVVAKLIRTTGKKLSTLTTVKYTRADSSGGEGFEEVKCNIKLSEYFDGQTMFDHINGSLGGGKSCSSEPERLYFTLGRVCNQLFVYLRTQQHLLTKLDAIRTRGQYPWQLKTCEPNIRQNLGLLYSRGADTGLSSKRRQLVERTLDEFNSFTKPRLVQLPEFIIHSDLCNKNILIKRSQAQDQICLIDFQDLQVGQQVLELAIMILYNVIEQEIMPFERALNLIPRWIYLGYQSSTSLPLNPSEMVLVPGLMKLRLVQSLLNGQVAFEREPQNSYVMQTNKRGWRLLELMSDATSNFGKADELASLWLTASHSAVSSAPLPK